MILINSYLEWAVQFGRSSRKSIKFSISKELNIGIFFSYKFWGNNKWFEVDFCNLSISTTW